MARGGSQFHHFNCELQDEAEDGDDEEDSPNLTRDMWLGLSHQLVILVLFFLLLVKDIRS